MRSRASDASIGGRGPGLAGYLIGRIVQGLLIAAISGGLFWLVWIYGNGLRDPRYLDGWVLAGGMAMQVSFHIAKMAGLSLKSATRWRKMHIFAGYLVIAAFISHSDFSLPDTGFEWALWTGFVLVTLSGIFGTYLVWSLKAKGRIDEGVSYDRIPALRAELELAFLRAVAETNPPAAAIDLPGLPHDAWITDLYTTHLEDFFQGPRNFSAHLIGSQRPLKRLTAAIDNLSALCRPAEPGEARLHQEPGGREGPARFRAGLSRTYQGLAVRACARHLCADRADGIARPRRLCLFIGCLVMWRPGRIKSVRPPKAGRQAPASSRRNQLAVLLALVTAVCLGSALYFSKGTQLLMPGPLTSGHAAIENCNACHTKSGSNKISWLHGLVAADPLADSKACLTCHKMPATAFNPHGASAEVLKQSTKRLTKIAARIDCAAICYRAKRRIPDERCHRRRSLLRNLPPGASGRKFQSEQNIQRAMPLVPRCEVRQLRRPSPGFPELSVRAAYANYLRSCQPFRQALPGIGKEGSGKTYSFNLRGLPQQQ